MIVLYFENNFLVRNFLFGFSLLKQNKISRRKTDSRKVQTENCCYQFYSLLRKIQFDEIKRKKGLVEIIKFMSCLLCAIIGEIQIESVRKFGKRKPQTYNSIIKNHSSINGL